MDRKELSFMIKNMRENSGVSKYRASKDSGLTEIQIGYMDDGTHSYSNECKYEPDFCDKRYSSRI